jgi:methyl-accepting chemotaxis protein
MLRDLRIGPRLALGFGIVVFIMAAVALGATWVGQSSRDGLAEVIETAGAKEALAAQMKAFLLEQSNAMRSVGLRTEVKDMQHDEDRVRWLGERYDGAIARMEKLKLSPEEAAVISTLRDVSHRIDEPFKDALALATGFQVESAIEAITKRIDPPLEEAVAGLDRMIEIQKSANREAIRATRELGDRLNMAVYAAQVIVVLLSMLVAWYVTRTIVGPLGDAVGIAKRVASGDLASRIDPQGRDEAADLLVALRDMNAGLGEMVLRIRSGSESIAVGASEVATGNQQLSSRTEEHASSLAETASTLEEFTSTVQQNAEHAKQASDLAGSASATAEKGGEAVGHVVSTMKKVSTSSKRISDIIAVIDGISFQTNILSLNAAVEAARAGEHGRGFAVVASEIRGLAQRSAESAREIRALIEDSVNHVETSAKLVEQAGRTINDLVESVKRVADIMIEIASASRQQSAGIEQINKAIAQMDAVVQLNASLVEEATAAATSMANQATGLVHAVAQFHLGDAPAAAKAATPAIAVEVVPAGHRIRGLKTVH